MSEPVVRELAPEELPLWDELVNLSNEGTVFHLSHWVNTVGALTGMKPSFFGYFQGEKLEGGCSLYTHSFYHLLRYATSTTSMTPFSGFCIRPSESKKGKKQLLHHHTILQALNCHLENTYDFINIVSAPEFVDIRPNIWNKWKSEVFFTYYLDLQDNFDALGSRYLRNSLKKAQKFEILVRKESNVHQYYDLVRKTFEKQHLDPVVTESFFNNIVTMVRSNDLGDMWVAETPTGQVASSIIILWDTKRVHAWSAASDPELKGTGAHTLLLQEIFREMRERGYSEINLMTGNMPHLTTFYSSFHPRLVPYYGVVRMNRKLKILRSMKDIFNGK